MPVEMTSTPRCRQAIATLAATAAIATAACGGNPAGPSTVNGSPTSGTGQSTSDVRLADDFGGRALLPSDNWWNQDISNAPLDPQSDAYIDFIGRTRQSHPDFGPPPYGIPFVGVGGTQA